MVESIIGIRGKDFVLLAHDANTTKYGILNMKFDTNRLFKLSEHCAILAGKIRISIYTHGMFIPTEKTKELLIKFLMIDIKFRKGSFMKIS